MTPAKTAKQQRGKPFVKGCSGNPSGRPQGSRNCATIAAEALLDGEANALTRKAIDMALAGDSTAMRLCLERVLPVRRGRPMNFRLPTLSNAADAALAMATIVAGVAEGSLTASEASELSNLVDGYVRALEASELERRVKQIEAQLQTEAL